MKNELPEDYDISVENMLDMNKSQELGGFKAQGTTFYNKKGKQIPKQILRNEEESKQIFQMKDGKFILEEETFDDKGGDILYFYSDVITDLI